MKCDDICFQHILPRLNSYDIKFFYGVNTETRALVKRSSRAGDLKEKFKVQEMSSISINWKLCVIFFTFWVSGKRLSFLLLEKEKNFSG